MKRRRVFNTDQGSQFTCEAFTYVLKGHAIAISMDGKGRWVDNVFVERLWRSVKYEDVYLRAYETPTELRAGLARYFGFYNTRRRHSALDRRTPDAVYFDPGSPRFGSLKPEEDFTYRTVQFSGSISHWPQRSSHNAHETIVLSMLTGHGRATTLMWKTVQASTLKGNQRRYKDELLRSLREAMPTGVKVTVVADRGFGNGPMFQYLSEELGFEYVIRLRGDLYVTRAKGERRKASEWVGVNGRSRTLRGATVTDVHALPGGTVVCVHAKAMKESWCVVASETNIGTRTLIR